MLYSYSYVRKRRYFNYFKIIRVQENIRYTECPPLPTKKRMNGSNACGKLKCDKRMPRLHTCTLFYTVVCSKVQNKIVNERRDDFFKTFTVCFQTKYIAQSFL